MSLCSLRYFIKIIKNKTGLKPCRQKRVHDENKIHRLYTDGKQVEESSENLNLFSEILLRSGPLDPDNLRKTYKLEELNTNHAVKVK